MKKLALVLSLVLMLTFVGCSSKTTVKETDAFRFDSKTGYAYSTAPFGIDTTELESAIGSKLTMVSESPATAPFAYTNYSSEDIVQSADCSGKFDAQFDENGKLFSVAFHEQLARGTATTTFTGQNIGAGRLDRVEKGTKDGLKLGLSVSVVLVALILFFGRYLMEMFTSTPEVIDTGMHMMRILAIGYIAMAVTQILSGVMRGAGDTMTPMWISLITTVVIRVPIAYGLAALMHSADALFISLLISWVMGAVLTSIAFRMGRWKKKSIINDDVPEPADVQV